jgi:threonine-phosphate decarboxylase
LELHGGNIHKIRREKNIEILDYSSNINSLTLPENLKNEIVSKFNGVLSYPDPDYLDLRTALAEYCNVDVADITVGNGATEIIFLYMKSLKVKRAVILSPTFAEYERAVKAAGGEADYFELKEEDGFKINIESLKEKIENEKYDVVVICNPNNPTGVLTELEKIEEIYKICEASSTKLFIDEAFIEFTSKGFENSAINLGRECKNLFVIRAFTKFFGMPGIRLGYSICFNKELNQKMLKLKEPWSVNWFADVAGRFMVKEKEFIINSKKKIEEEKKYMKSELLKIEGIKIYNGDTNFLLINLINCDGERVNKKLIEKGIMIRECCNFPFLNKKFIRCAIKDRKSNIEFIEKLKKTVMEVENESFK